MDGSAAKDTIFESKKYGFIVKSGEGYVIMDPFLTEGTLECNIIFFIINLWVYSGILINYFIYNIYFFNSEFC